jgi:putative redox protein
MANQERPASERTVDLVRSGEARFTATNVRGGTIEIGDGVESDLFTPIELLLAALAGCSGLDVDAILSKRSEFEFFGINARADKVRDDDGNHLVNIQVTFDAEFPEGEAGQSARDFLPKAMAKSHDRICTVSRTVQLGAPVDYRVP